MKWRIQQMPDIHLQGPAAHAELSADQRVPVACDFTDELESISVKKYEVVVTFGDTSEAAQKIKGFIQDFVIRDKIEYMVMDDGTEVRLDRIRSINTEN
jgi:Rho-binding antiterminator